MPRPLDSHPNPEPVRLGRTVRGKFPKKQFDPVEPHPNFSKLEEEILKFWEANKIFEKSLERNAPQNYPRPSRERGRRSSGGVRGKPFTFYDGPPFATGLPHYGHILASTIKDVIPRYQTMRGRFVRRRWGWDCHGLPIEEIVERELGISGKKDIEKIGIKKFNETCRSMVLMYVEEWGKIVRRIARWVEFDNSYKTMDRDYMESVWWAFKQIYDKGLVYEGRKVLLYCPRCETPISNFEVAMDNSYKDVTEEAVIVKFRIKTQERKNQRTREPKVHEFISPSVPTFFLAWTTTPWTLVGNAALAVNPDVEYAKVKMGNEFYVMARNLTPTPSDLGEGVRGEVKGTFKGKDLVGLEYEPLFDIPEMRSPKSFQVYGADFVTAEEGTGIVHTAVVYGEEDYALGQKIGLPVVPLLDEKGKFNERAPELVRGQYFKEAEQTIKADLEKRGLLFEKKMHSHSYPHCWRCDTQLFYNAIPAWFVNISKIKKQILKSNKKEINWYPEHLKLGRYAKSVESAPDWNISRNRYWGNPMPVWRCTKCQKDTVVGSVAELQKKAIVPLTPALSPPRRRRGRKGEEGELDLHRPYIDEVILKCDYCGGEARRITEIFDSWVEAGSMPFAEYHYPFTPTSSPPIRPPKSDGTGGEREGVGFPFPAQFVAEYIAQTRAWFYVMHVVSLILFGRAPFENVVTTGTILAEDGSKMSKSRRNFPDPWEVIAKYGVDSLRFYLMNSVVMQADNLNFSERDLGNVHRKVVLILWNVYNYFVTYANATPTSPARHASRAEAGGSPPIRPPKADGTGGEREGVLDVWILARLQELISKATEHLDTYDTVRATREIEIFINDLSTWYLRRSRGRSDRAFFATLHQCLVELSKVTAPFMPYVAEMIYQNLSNSVIARSEATKQSYGHEIAARPSAARNDDCFNSVHLTDWPKAKKLTAKQQNLLKQMQAVREIVEQVHALRARAGIKLRQKLRRLTIPSSVIARTPTRGRGTKQSQGKQIASLPLAMTEILKSEVNVQEVVFGDKLELDTTITPELKIEGLARELERQIQEFRKQSGLKIGQMVDLYYETKSAKIEEAMKLVDRKKIYVKNLEANNPLSLSPLHKGEKVGVKEMEVEGDRVKFLISN